MKKKAVPKLPREQLENLPVGIREYITALEDYLAWLEKKVNRNSRNTSLPPSSDLNPPPKNRKKKDGRSVGGQPGHLGNTRPLEKPDRTIPHFPEICNRCGSVFHGNEEEVGTPVIISIESWWTSPPKLSRMNITAASAGIARNRFWLKFLLRPWSVLAPN